MKSKIWIVFISLLISVMSNDNFDFGVAFDGDADRCVFIDNKARSVSAEKIGIIVSKRNRGQWGIPLSR